MSGADLLTLAKADIQGYLEHVRRQHSPATEQVRYRSLHRFYSWAEDEELVSRSPMARMKLPRAPEKIIPVPEQDNLRVLLRACRGEDFESIRDTAIIRLMADTGLRLSEVASLTLDRVDPGLTQVRVMGKGARERPVRYERSTGKALSKYLRARSRHPLAHLNALWVGARGVALTANGITQVLRRRCDQAGIQRIHPHQLRHFWASEVFRQGMSDRDAMRLAGWSSRLMPIRYGAATSTAQALAHRGDVTIGGAL